MDEQNQEQQPDKGQTEAQAKTNTPAPIVDAMQADREQALKDRREYLDRREKFKEVAAQYGCANLDDVLARAGSDGPFAIRVINNLLDGNKDAVGMTHPDSPQEHNITGILDHSGDTPTKLKTASQTSNPVPDPPAGSEQEGL